MLQFMGSQRIEQLSDCTTKRLLAGGFHPVATDYNLLGKFWKKKKKSTYPGPVPVQLNQNL